MDNITYSWLLNSKEQSPKLIDCILILSCNDLFISHDNLIQYYNENGKRYNNSSNGNNENTLGLSDKQFNILHNNIGKLQNLINTNYANNNINSISINKNDNKFDWSINIIIHNNTNNNNNNNNNNNSNNKRIKNSNNHQIIKLQRGSSREMNQLFYMVWRNMVIRNEILFHSRLYKTLSRTFFRFTLQQLNQYKYKHYINKLELGLTNKDQTLKSNSIPNGVRDIYLNYFHEIEINSIPDSVTCISFPVEFNQTISKGMIPDSVTSIEFFEFNRSLNGGWLPKSIKHLDLGYSFQQPILPGQLPESLTELGLPEDYRGKIIAGSIPSAVKNLDYTFKSNNGEKLLKSDSIPMTTTGLVFDESFDQDIKVGDIPHNVTTITFKSNPSNIAPNSLPISLTSITFKSTSNAIVNNVPPNLTYINMGKYIHPLVPNFFPRSIQTIKLSSYSQIIPVGYFYYYSTLTTLDLRNFNQDEIPLRTLPKSLTHLNISWFDGPIDAITELKSLKTLYLGGLEREITAGQLPESITTLGLKTTLPIGPNLLPSNLKELYINNIEFNHDISIDGYLPTQSLQSIYIFENTVHIIDRLDVNFFSKYIKFNQTYSHK